MRAGLGRRRAPGQGGRRRGTRPAGRARKVPQLGPGGGGGTEAQGIGTGRAAHGEGGEPRSASAGLRPDPPPLRPRSALELRRLILRLPQDCESRRPRDTLSGVTVGGFPCSASRRRVCSRPGPMRFSGSTSRSQAASYERSDPYRAGRSQGPRPCDGQGSRGCRPDASASYTALASERASVQTSFRVQRLCRWKALIITVSGSWLIPAFAVISYKHVLTFVTIAL